MSRLSSAHWIAVLLSLMLTTGAWYFTNMQVQQQSENRFDRYSGQVLELMQERLTKYEDALAAGVAAVHASGGDMSLAQWQEFSGALQIETKYPGINGMGIIYRIPRSSLGEFLAEQRQIRPDFKVFPEHGEKVLYPITYIEPSGENSKAIGLDMAHEANRLNATLRARDSGQPQITGPIVLVQDAQKTPGFLFYMPIYKDKKSRTAEERSENFVGMVYAPFVFQKLIEGVLGKENRLVHFSVRDNDSVLYTEEDERSGAYDPEFTSTRSFDAYGRTWTFDLWDTPAFKAASHSNEPMMILIGGLVIDGLLFSLFFLLANSNKRALRFADQMAEEASTRAEFLQRSNEDLERFAFVASHDLKTPLRGIGFLADCIRDDLVKLDSVVKETELFENLSTLEHQIQRMENLISGILSYSSANSDNLEPERTNIASLIPDVCSDAGLVQTQFKVTGDPVEITTDSVRLQQVLQNLIGNAAKYHPDPKKLEVIIDISDLGERLKFTVSDNGKGIEPRYHEKIFEIFQTLNEAGTSDSTGIGLAIVQKIVHAHGGNIHLESEIGKGSSFSFDWPKELKTAAPLQEAA